MSPVILRLLSEFFHQAGQLGGPHGVADRQNFLAQVCFRPIDSVIHDPMADGAAARRVERDWECAEILWKGLRRKKGRGP